MPQSDTAAAAVLAVAQPIVAATDQADGVVLNCTAAITALVTERRVNKLPLSAGAAELPLIAQALVKQAEARAALIHARLELVKVPSRLGVLGYGPECLCDGDSLKQNGMAPAAALARRESPVTTDA